MSSRRAGLVHGVLAYALWGGVAAYWKLLAHVDAVELLAHRALWGLVAFVLIVLAFRQWSTLRRALADRRLLGMMAISGAMIGVNWGTFVWATVEGHLLEASLGYFINPLLSVALGTLVLRERLRRLQWLAIALATIGVTVMTWRAGQLPWVSLVLAGTFAVYGYLRKTARVEAVVGSAVETILLAPIAIGYLVACTDGAVFGDPPTLALLAGTGAVTAVPLVLFASAARKLPLSTVGFLQYLAPTGQFVLAVFAFGEPLAHGRLFAFAWIWAGLVVFSIDLVRNATHRAAQAAIDRRR